jgi:hypothetical protein
VLALTGLACCRGRTRRRVGSCEGVQCSITAPVRTGCPFVLPAGALAWRGELEPCVSSPGGGGAQVLGRRHVRVGPRIPRSDLHVWAPP